jgi:aspartyl-tRNA(Asn)/glutamyl-tRNA(Gln) amidotransferase subunit C
MNVTSTDVAHVARLARLAVTEEEIGPLTEQLNAILSYMETLNRLDTTSIEPTAHVLSLANVLREDVAQPSLGVERVLRNAPERDGAHFRVPKIIA